MFEKFAKDPEDVWAYGVRYFAGSPKGKYDRGWTLPDGLLLGPHTYVVELDHGDNTKDFAEKLAKAARNLFSSGVHGLLFAYSYELPDEFNLPVFDEGFRNYLTASKKPVVVIVQSADSRAGNWSGTVIKDCLKGVYLENPQRREDSARKVEAILKLL